MKNLLLALSITALIIGLISCSPKSDKPGRSSLSDTVNITYVKAPLNVPLIVAKNMKIYEENFAQAKEPRNVQFHELTSGPQQTEALAAEAVDFTSVLGATSAILSAANGSALRIIGIFARAPKAFVIETMKDNIKTVADLKGKKIAGPKGTILHQLLIAALKREGLSINDVDFVSMMLPEALTAMTAGKIDAALLAGGPMMQGLTKGARILTDGENLVEGTTVIATRKDILDNNPDVVSTYLDAHRKSVKAMVDNWEQAISMSAEELGINREEVEKTINLYDFDMVIKPNDKTELKKTQQFLIENSLLDQPINIEELVITNW